MFYYDLVKISKFAFTLFEPNTHHKQFLHDIIEFNDLMLRMLEEYSKGKVLTIQTHKRKKVKKNKKKSKKANFYGEMDRDEVELQKKMNEEN